MEGGWYSGCGWWHDGVGDLREGMWWWGRWCWEKDVWDAGYEIAVVQPLSLMFLTACSSSINYAARI